MEVILVVVVTFALCFGVDKGFTKLFRGKAQHQSGKSVLLSKYYGLGGLILVILGIAAVISGISNGMILLAGGIIVFLMGACLLVYYLTFGVFYDDDSFILTTFGKKSTTYRYQDIKGQQLYVITGGNTVVELHMTDGRAVQLQSSMEGVYPFLDHAYAAWLRQTGRDPEDCDFHDTANSCWFPPMED